MAWRAIRIAIAASSLDTEACHVSPGCHPCGAEGIKLMATPPDDGSGPVATAEQVEAEIERLTDADLVRLRNVARVEIRGTSFSDPGEVVSIAVQDPWLAALGEGGRRWPPNIPFGAYLIMTIRGLCKDDRRRLWRAAKKGAMRENEDDAAADVADLAERGEEARNTLTALFAFFAQDKEVQWIIKGQHDGLSPAEVRQHCRMTETGYNTARRRLRRGMERLLPERAQAARRLARHRRSVRTRRR
jgi:DNA-directed RNA polymerase specialized sigma24 family protein